MCIVKVEHQIYSSDMGYFRFHRAEVLKNLFDVLADISPARYITSRPSSTSQNLPSYTVIRMANGIRDKGDTYQTAKVLLHVFVRDLPGDIEDTLGLEKIQSQICDLFPLMFPRFSASDPNIIGSGADSGFHYLIIQISLTINKKTINQQTI